MAYTALYRKLRPQTFRDVIGQKHIIRTLKNQIENARIPHAYLFCGTRGTGKTSTAKIFAKAVNCENPAAGEPCNTCPSCLSANRGSSLNIIEIDAASNNSVDNIRELREEVKYPPTGAPYKVYIIDEVHMLSASAFNALLKTLEEPPDHIIFILATTDPQKIPVTIHSRCQRFDFKRISSGDMQSALKEYMEAENVHITDESLRYICRLSDGALRDALSILDQAVSFYLNEEITLEKILAITGAVNNEVFFHFTSLLFTHDSKALLGLIEQIIADGRDVAQFAADLIGHFRNLLVAKSAGSDLFDCSEEEKERLKLQADEIDTSTLVSYITAFSELQAKLKYAGNGRALLEVACIRLCNPSVQDSGDSIFSRLKKLEAALESGVVPSLAAEAAVKKNSQTPKPVLKKSVPDDIKEVCAKWQSFIKSLSGSKEMVYLQSYLSTSQAKYLSDSVLTIVFENKPALKRIQDTEEKQPFIKEKLENIFKKEFVLNFMTEKEYNEKHLEKYGAPDEEKFIDELKSKLNINVEIQE